MHKICKQDSEIVILTMNHYLEKKQQEKQTSKQKNRIKNVKTTMKKQ